MCNLTHPMAARADEIQPGDTVHGNPATLPNPTLANPYDDGDLGDDKPLRHNSAISDPSNLENHDTAAPLYNIKRPTKFGQLMKIAMPLMIGAGIGATSNSRQGGAGLQNSETFFNHLNQMRMQGRQNQVLNETRISNAQRADAQAKLDAERAKQAQETLDRQATQPTGPVIKVKDATGKTVEKQWSPKDRDYVVIGEQPESEKHSIQDTDQGLMDVNTETDEATPIRTKPSATITSGLPDEPPTVTQQPGETLHRASDMSRTAKDKKPHPVAETNTDEKGVQTTQYRDMNPDSPTYRQIIPVSGQATRNPKPEKPNATEIGDKAESYAQYAVDKANGDIDKAIKIVNGANIETETKGSIIKSLRARQPKGKASRISSSVKKAAINSVPATPPGQ